MFELLNQKTQLSQEATEFLNGFVGYNNWSINGNGEVDCVSGVNISGMELSLIPVKFGSVSGGFDCSNNNFESFEFLPEHCSGNYFIHKNPGCSGILDHLYRALSGVFFKKFIKLCLQSDVWFEGQTNQHAMNEAFIDLKSIEYQNNKNFIFENINFIDLYDDKHIICDFFGVNEKDPDWLNKIISKILDKIKDSSIDDYRRIDTILLQYFDVLRMIILKGGDEVKDILVDDYDLMELFKKGAVENELNCVFTIHKKLHRTEEQKIRDDNYDLFAFVGRDRFIRKENGDYRRELEIENLCKMNIYDPISLVNIHGMKLRAQSNTGAVYQIWLPKGTFGDIEKDNYFEKEIPNYLINLIDSKKERIFV